MGSYVQFFRLGFLRDAPNHIHMPVHLAKRAATTLVKRMFRNKNQTGNTLCFYI